jgi:hypothetical protein
MLIYIESLAGDPARTQCKKWLYNISLAQIRQHPFIFAAYLRQGGSKGK